MLSWCTIQGGVEKTLSDLKSVNIRGDARLIRLPYREEMEGGGSPFYCCERGRINGRE